MKTITRRWFLGCLLSVPFLGKKTPAASVPTGGVVTSSSLVMLAGHRHVWIRVSGGPWTRADWPRWEAFTKFNRAAHGLEVRSVDVQDATPPAAASNRDHDERISRTEDR